MTTYTVEVLEDGWVPCVREDLYADAGDPECLNTPATFNTHEAAEQFIRNMRGMMHMGGHDTEFRIVEIGKSECPACHNYAQLSDTQEGAIEFIEPICEACRTNAIRYSQMDAFDEAYERLVANGWSD